MELLENVTVAEIAARSLAAVRVFEKYGIDYCCGGKRPLEDVCRQQGHDARLLREELEKACSDQPGSERDWAAAPLRQLAEHIVSVHHGYLRRELPAIQARLDKVYSVYNQRYGPTLIGLPEVFAGLRQELELHIRKEEAILFPAIGMLEEAAQECRPLPRMMFGTIAAPIHMMEKEHDGAGDALRQIRAITRDFEVPEFACATYNALVKGLAELESDLHLHIHLENNVLFPQAIALEAQMPRR